MSCGAIAAAGLHPLIAFVAYGAALVLVVIGGLSRPPAISPGAAVITAVAAFVAALGMLVAGRLEVTPLAIVALLPLTVIGMVLIRGDGTARAGAARAGAPLLALALVVALADRQIFAPQAIGPGLLLAALVAVVAAAAAARGGWRPALYTLVLLTYASAGLAVLEVQPYRSDAVVATHGAAELFLEGRHPYADFDMLERLERFGVPADFATHLEDGTPLRSFNYPVLAFLVPAPFIATGLDDVRFIYLAEVLVLLVLVTISAREPWRPYALAAGVGGIAVMRQFVVAGVDPAWALLLLAAWLTRGARGSAVLLGLAISARQTAWPVAPLLILWTWRRHGRREALGHTAIAGAVALALHAPFLITAPEAVIGGITEVVLMPIERGGVGLSLLAAAGILPEVPRGVHTVAAAAAFGVLVWAYARRSVAPLSPLALAPLPLFLAWRGLQSYFALAPLLLLIEEGSEES